MRRYHLLAALAGQSCPFVDASNPPRHSSTSRLQPNTGGHIRRGAVVRVENTDTADKQTVSTPHKHRKARGNYTTLIKPSGPEAIVKAENTRASLGLDKERAMGVPLHRMKSLDREWQNLQQNGVRPQPQQTTPASPHLKSSFVASPRHKVPLEGRHKYTENSPRLPGI